MTNSAASEPEPAFIEVGKDDGQRRIAVRARAGGAPGLFWLGGFNSDMRGTKALALDPGRPSTAAPAYGSTIPAMANPAARSLTAPSGAGWRRASRCSSSSAAGPQVVIGSSMGGWMALLLAREIARRPQSRASLAGLVLIAPAPDFTEELMWKAFRRRSAQEIETKGVWLRPSEYGEPYPITRALIEEGRNHLLLGSAIDVGCPVRILQGAQDPDVPWQHAFALAHRLPSRRCGADHDPGRRSPPVAAAGHRADPRGGGGDGVEF